MVETISKRLLLRDFGGGWVVRPWFSGKVRSLQISEVLRFRTRRIHPRVRGIVHDDGQTDRVFDTPEAATRHLVAQEGRRLQAEIDALKERRASILRQARGWRGLRRRWNRAVVQALNTELDAADSRLRMYERQRATLSRDQVGVAPLPDRVEHAGRLELGASVWVLDWSDETGNCPIFEYAVVAETVELADHPADPTTMSMTFRYDTEPRETAKRWPGRLTVEMRGEGPIVRSPYGLSVYLDLVEASNGRIDSIEGAKTEADETPAAGGPDD